MKFLDLLQSHILLLDGAIRTELYTQGILKSGECAELLNITRPLDVLDMHLAYADAGANILTANTYAANAMKLAPFSLQSRAEELVASGVTLCREAAAARENTFVAASIGATGEHYTSDPRMPQRMYNAFYEQCTHAAAAGADLILIESMSDVREARLALLAARAASSLPILISFTLEPDAHTYAQNPPEVLALVAQKLGAALVGVNCGLLPAELFEGYSRLLGNSFIPTFAAPNAGHSIDNRLSPEDMARDMLPYLHSGAYAIGGCCYTTPAHTRALRAMLDERHGHARHPRLQDTFICASAKRVLLSEFEQGSPVNIAGMHLGQAFETIRQAALSSPALQIDLADWEGEAIRTLLFELSPYILKTPLAFHVHSSRQADAALFAYPGIAALFAQSDAYNVMKSAARYGAEVMI